MSSGQTIFKNECLRCDMQINGFQEAFNASQTPLHLFSDNFRILDINPAMARLCRFTRVELLEQPLHVLFPRTEDYHELLSREPLPPWLPLLTFSTLMQTRHRGAIPVEITIAPHPSNRKSKPVFQAQVKPVKDSSGEQIDIACRTADRLRSIGALAGGIAHHFNNILTGIYGNITLARLELSEQPAPVHYLEKAEESMEEAVKLTRQLLTFAKGGDPVKTTFDPGPLIKETVQFNLSGSKVKAHLNIQADLWPVHGDKDQVTQVITNIVINACQAMPRGGTLAVDAGNATLLKDNLLTIAKGSYLKICITDKGTGIAQSDLDRIFDPYFTTRPGGKGMGLSICHSIVTKHNGYIHATSQLGSGTALTLYLPAAPEKAAKEETMTSKSNDTSHRASILVMDDEEHIRTITHKMLEKFGYQVTLTEDGEEAVSAYTQALEAGTPFDLVIMDLTIPGGMGGQEASAIILDMDPSAVIVVSSGYSNDKVMADYRTYGLKGIIPKPFRLAELKSTIEKLIP